MLFAKNSDREPWEPLFLERVRGKSHPPGAKLRCTYIEIDQVPYTHDTLLYRPSWIWGAEMGVNQHGVAIGNEAVFTRVRFGSPALLGMDLVRLALERASTAEESVEIITRLLEKHGQGGPCKFSGKFQYHNGFLVADGQKAFILETAGKHWAVYAVRETGALSNTLTIRHTFEQSSRNLNHSSSRHTRHTGSYDFKKTFELPIHTRLGGGEKRLRITQSFLRSHAGSLTYSDIFSLLRHHRLQCPFPRFAMKRNADVCMHPGGIPSFQTTGSLVVEVRREEITAFASCGPLPCLSLYKPFWFTHNPLSWLEGKKSQELLKEFWFLREEFARYALQGRVQDMQAYLAWRDSFEVSLGKRMQQAETEAQKIDLSEEAFLTEKKVVSSKLARARPVKPRMFWSPREAWYWKKHERSLQKISLALTKTSQERSDLQ